MKRILLSFILISVALAFGLFPMACSSNNNPTAPATATITPTITPTNWAGYTNTFTLTPTATATSTATNVNGYTSTFTITSTSTATSTSTPTNVSGYTSTFTATATSSSTPSNTATTTGTFTPSSTITPAFTSTPTNTATFLNGNTATSTPTNNSAYTSTFTPTATFTVIPFTQGGPAVTFPNGLALGSNGDIYVAEGGSDFDASVTMVQVFGSSGNTLLTLTSYGSTAFKNPNGVAVNSGGTTFYVVDSENSAIYGFTSNGTAAVSWATWTGGAVTSFSHPEGIAVTTMLSGPVTGDIVYVADTGNNVVEEFAVSGASVSYVGQWNGADSGYSSFSVPSAVALAGSNIFVADVDNGVIRSYNPLGTPSGAPITTVSNSDIFGIAADGSGDIFAADSGNSAVEEYNVSAPGGAINEWNSYGSVTFLSPDGVALTGTGGLWVTDFGNGPNGTGTLSEIGF